MVPLCSIVRKSHARAEFTACISRPRASVSFSLLTLQLDFDAGLVCQTTLQSLLVGRSVGTRGTKCVIALSQLVQFDV